MAKMRNLAAVLLPLLLLCACGGPSERGLSTRRPNVLLVLIDTIRSDHMSCYGYCRQTTPHLDSLAESGTRFSNVMSGSPWTLPSMTTIFTGLPERVHRARLSDMKFFGVDPALPFMPLLLKEEGYRTAAFFNVIYMSEHFGFHRGFDHFDCQGLVELWNSRTAGQTVDEMLTWLDSTGTDAPFFVALHLFDPHATYNPPAPYDTIWTDPAYSGRFDSSWGVRTDMEEANTGVVTVDSAGRHNLINLYDGELAYADAELGRLFSELRRRGLEESTMVVVIGDHGEEFAEHGRYTHGHSLHAELLQVPLILAGAGVEPGVVDTSLVGNIDVLPTVMAAAGSSAPEGSSGRDLLSPCDGPPRTLFASGLGGSRQACARRLDRKVVWHVEEDSAYAYDLAADPTEMNPLPPDSGLLAEAMDYWATPPRGNPRAVPWTNAVEDQLRDLGYIR